MFDANIQYELFVKEIYEYLHQAEGVENIDIQHNIKLKGISGCYHQIDVYWRFQIAGIEYQVAIECKNYQQRISIGKIRDFNSVLEDVGNINGIFVSKNGFQRGAKEYAKQKRIKLIEMRHPNNNDWKGRMRNLHFSLNAYFKHIKSRDIEVDKEWIKAQSIIQPGDSIKFSGMSNEIFIEDLTKKEKISFYDLENKLPVLEKGSDFKETITFENAYIIHPNTTDRVKIKSITYKYDVSCSTQEFEISGDDVAKAIVKDVINEEEQFIDIHGNIKRR